MPGRGCSRSSSCELSRISLVFRGRSRTVRDPPAPAADRPRPNHRPLPSLDDAVRRRAAPQTARGDPQSARPRRRARRRRRRRLGERHPPTRAKPSRLLASTPTSETVKQLVADDDRAVDRPDVAVGRSCATRPASAMPRRGRRGSAIAPVKSWAGPGVGVEDLHGEHGERGAGPSRGTRGWSNSTSDEDAAPSACWASRLGCAGSETSKSETCMPLVRPSASRPGPTPSSRSVADRVQVGRVAEELELAEDLGRRRVGEVDRVERVDLAEGHDVAGVADEAHRVDALALAEAADAPDGRERCALPAAARSRSSAV